MITGIITIPVDIYKFQKDHRSRKEPKRKIDSSIPQQRAMETELPGEIRAVVEPIKTELKAESAELKATVPEARTTSSRAMRPGPSESVHMPLLEDIDIVNNND
ncbi:hypothetical protein PG995_007836 [Apiospora arundinis]